MCSEGGHDRQWKSLLGLVLQFTQLLKVFERKDRAISQISLSSMRKCCFLFRPCLASVISPKPVIGSASRIPMYMVYHFHLPLGQCSGWIDCTSRRSFSFRVLHHGDAPPHRQWPSISCDPHARCQAKRISQALTGT